jgi:hypothetical protein
MQKKVQAQGDRLVFHARDDVSGDTRLTSHLELMSHRLDYDWCVTLSDTEILINPLECVLCIREPQEKCIVK